MNTRPHGTYLTQLELIKDISTSERLILIAFGSMLTYSGKDFQDYKEWRYVSPAQLNQKTHISERWIQNSLKSLILKGYLEYKPNKKPNNADAANWYRFTKKALPDIGGG